MSSVCIFCGGECGRVCRGLGFKRTQGSSKKARNDSGGGRESGPATHIKSQPGPKKALLGREVAPVMPTSSAGVTPGPPETKKKRSPRGTFDRTAYQRELMRKRRKASKNG